MGPTDKLFVPGCAIRTTAYTAEFPLLLSGGGPVQDVFVGRGATQSMTSPSALEAEGSPPPDRLLNGSGTMPVDRPSDWPSLNP